MIFFLAGGINCEPARSTTSLKRIFYIKIKVFVIVIELFIIINVFVINFSSCFGSKIKFQRYKLYCSDRYIMNTCT